MPIRYKGLDILVQYAKGCLNILDTNDVGRAMSVPDVGGWKMIRYDESEISTDFHRQSSHHKRQSANHTSVHTYSVLTVKRMSTSNHTPDMQTKRCECTTPNKIEVDNSSESTTKCTNFPYNFRYYSGHGAPVAEQDQTTKIVETVICTIALGTLCQLLT
ncbi:unnamed protein product [Callosobruchus maculatus]|uniref:Uncharacterized protein n=1 Tax=Callosobruchus maculatus TaxID=64391 RepID=A0A653CI61_CALMS|nr:unnamed protein product [Callosobruchus maculatus]